MIQPGDIDNIAVAALAAIGIAFHVLYLYRAWRVWHRVPRIYLCLKGLSALVLVGVVVVQALVVAGVYTPATAELIRWVNAGMVLSATAGAIANGGSRGGAHG